MRITQGHEHSHCSTTIKRGRGLLNKVIDLLPLELHLPGGYRFCGPGTKLSERLARGDTGINQLDEACKQHDIAYAKYSDDHNRNIADRILANKAWERVKSSDASLAERTAAWLVTTAMNAKSKLGMGHIRSRRNQRKTRGVCRRQRVKRVKGSGRRQKRRGTGKGLYLRPYEPKN